MITIDKSCFVLETERTAYAFAITAQGLPRHLYYGPKLPDYSALPIPQATVGGAAFIEGDQPESMAQECSAPGWGDSAPYMVSLVLPDGGTACSFRYVHCERSDQVPQGLPHAQGGETLKIVLKEQSWDVYLELYYTAVEDAIVRWCRVVNDCGEAIRVRRLLSAQLDLPRGDYRLTTYRGAWAREMTPLTQPLHGALVWDSSFGISSSRCNTLAVVSHADANEHEGSVWCTNLLYSGGHYGCAHESPFGRVRLVQGMADLDWLLPAGEHFDSPQAALFYASDGFAGARQAMHRFVERALIAPAWQQAPRPIVVNSWESLYFRLSRAKLLQLGKEAAAIGAEVLVVDDGWFIGRKDDKRALGDWTEDEKKLPGGFPRLQADLKKLGIDLGVWVEPEMVSEESNLFRAHGDWILGHRNQAMGRNQFVLDLGRTEVQNHVYESVARILRSADIRYIKWDMNRCLTDTFSPALPASRQGEIAHRYVLGLYQVCRRLTEDFPHVLFEGCASGGNRPDWGMLCYFPQFWCSDDTDAEARSHIQSGYYAAYPPSTLSCHVSACPNHQTLRTTPLHSRFHLSCFGLLGYELDLTALTREEKAAVREQIALYKAHRPLFQFGQFHATLATGNELFWMLTTGQEAVGVHYVRHPQPNALPTVLHAAGLEGGASYTVRSVPQAVKLEQFGSLVNMLSPVHLRQGSALHALAGKVVRFEEKPLALTASGESLMAAGFPQVSRFNGAAFEEGMAAMGDWDSRLYWFEKV